MKTPTTHHGSQALILNKYIVAFAILWVVLLAGCTDFQATFEISSGPKKRVSEPAVLLATKTQHESLFHAIFPSPKKSKIGSKEFSGVDSTRSMAACIWLADSNKPSPIVYIPVNDYEKFVDGLSKRYPLKQAIASKFISDRHQFVVLQSNGYAKIAPSLDAAKKSRSIDSSLFADLPSDKDFILKWNPPSPGNQHSAKFRKSIAHLLGNELEPLLDLNSSFVCSFDQNKRNGVDVQLESPQPDAELKSKLSKNFEIASWESPDSGNNTLAFSIAQVADNQKKSAIDIQTASSKLFKSHLAAFAKRKTIGKRRGGTELDRLSNLISLSDGLVSQDSSQAASRPVNSSQKKCNTTRRR